MARSGNRLKSVAVKVACRLVNLVLDTPDPTTDTLAEFTLPICLFSCEVSLAPTKKFVRVAEQQ